jgi:hypothetical protein
MAREISPINSGTESIDARKLKIKKNFVSTKSNSVENLQSTFANQNKSKLLRSLAQKDAEIAKKDAYI